MANDKCSRCGGTGEVASTYSRGPEWLTCPVCQQCSICGDSKRTLYRVPSDGSNDPYLCGPCLKDVTIP